MTLTESSAPAQVSPHISVVVPVYMGENALLELYRRLRDSLVQITENFEIVLVEDCGGDNSWPMICDLAKEDPRVKGLQFSRNFGQHYGITAGLDLCDGDWVVVMDCDLQDQPEEIPRLYEKAQEGYDVVLARRGRRKDHPLKRFTSWLFYRIFCYLADIEYDGEVGNFRIVSRKVVDAYCGMKEQLRFFGAQMQWLGFETASIDVQHAARFEGKSTYTFAKLWKLSSETIIAYSDKPLRLTIRFGFLMALSSFFLGAYMLIRALFYGVTIEGWASIIVSMFFLGGIIITLLGIMGVYLGKTFDESKKRPLYVVSKKTESVMQAQIGSGQ